MPRHATRQWRHSPRAGGGSNFPGEQSSRYGKLKLNRALFVNGPW
jgi:hypothetical protein